MQPRPLTHAFGLAHRSMKSNWSVFLGAGVIWASMNFVIELPALMMDVAGIFDEMVQGTIPLGLQSMSGEERAATFLQTGIFLVQTIVNSLLWMGVLQLALAVVDGRPADIWDAVLDLELVPAAVLLGLVDLLIAPAFMCCVLPGLLLATVVFQWPTALLAKPGNLMDAFSTSVDLFRGEVLASTAMVALLSFISVVGTLFYHVPSVFIMPYLALVTVHMYRLRVPQQIEE
jgi:hypothetical protein